MTIGFGDAVFSRTAWGSKELFITFGYDGADKSVLSSFQAAEALLRDQVSHRSWVHLEEALEDIVRLSEEVSPTTNADVLTGSLQAIWNKWEAIMEGETPNESMYLRNIIKGIKDDVLPLRSVGRKVFKTIVLKHILNSFQVI